MTELEKVLTWVNDARIALGHVPISELPQGRRGQADECPIARAIGGHVWVLSKFVSCQTRTDALRLAMAWGHGGPTAYEAYTPPDIMRFVFAFDNGEYPELVDYNASTTKSKELV